MHYILIVWWLQILDILGHYIIRSGEVEQVLVMTNKIMNSGYTYAKSRLKNPP